MTPYSVKSATRITVATGRRPLIDQSIEVSLSDKAIPLTVTEARDLARALLEAVEAVTSDQILIAFLVQIGIDNPDLHNQVLHDLQDLRGQHTHTP